MTSSTATEITATDAFSGMKGREIGLRIDTAVTAGLTVHAQAEAVAKSGLCVRVRGDYWSLGLLGADRVAFRGGRCVKIDAAYLVELTAAWNPAG